MAFETELFLRGVYWRFYGVVTFDEILAANDQVWKRDDWEEFRFEIVDFLDTENLNLDDGDDRAAGHMDKVATARMQVLKVALVATAQEIILACEDYKTGVQGANIDVRIFDNLADASAWAKS